jgi:predicted kinase
MKSGNKIRLLEMMEKVNPDFHPKKPKLILPVGISGSGKSTWINSQLDSNTIVISPDEIRRELTGSISDQRRNNDVFAIAFKRTADALNAGKNVIFDATNLVSYHRKLMLNNLKQNVNKDFDAVAKIFDVDPAVAKQRVKKDIEKGVDRSNVPDYAIDRQYQNYINDLNSIELDGYKIIDDIKENDFKTSSDHFREINQMKNTRKYENAYTPEEKKEIVLIINELKKLGLVEGIDNDYKLEHYQDAYGTKTPRFEFDFYINKLEEKFGHSNIDSLLAKTNLDVFNPMVGSHVHGYIIRRLRIK